MSPHPVRLPSEPALEALRAELEKVRNLIVALEREGCSCDMMNGFVCPIHNTAAKAERLVTEARAALRVPAQEAPRSEIGTVERLVELRRATLMEGDNLDFLWSELDRLSREHTQCHEWNGQLVHEHYDLRGKIRALEAEAAPRAVEGAAPLEHRDDCAIYGGVNPEGPCDCSFDARADARIAELEAALAPFAAEYERPVEGTFSGDPYSPLARRAISMELLERARAVLSRREPQ